MYIYIYIYTEICNFIFYHQFSGCDHSAMLKNQKLTLRQLLHFKHWTIEKVQNWIMLLCDRLSLEAVRTELPLKYMP
jgi:hypothetical protein